MRTGRTILVWAVALLMTVDSASACRWRSWSYCSPCAPVACYSPCYSSCGPGWVSYPADNCPICKARGQAPVRADRVPSEPTPQPTLEPAPMPPAPSEPPAEAPPAEVPAPAPAPTPAPSEPLAPPSEPPAEKPAPDVEDLFKEPAPGEMPAEPAAPTTPPGEVDDLFKEPAPTEMPAEPAAPATPPGGADDLFNEPAPTDKPAEPAPGTPPGDVDDLFKVDDKKAAAAPPATSQELEDLFREPAAPASANAQQDKALQEEADKLFGTREADDDMRMWTDNTGKHHVRARLVSVGPAHVRLLKESGKYTTVPFERLSRADLAFVRQHADQAIAAN